jgi:beta-1,4-mannosyltransferase
MPGPMEHKVILLARVDAKLNPYIHLFAQALRREGLVAEVSERISPGWSPAAGVTVLHLHWAESLYGVRGPSSWRSYWVRRAWCNRVIAPLRSFSRLCFNLLAIAVYRLRGVWLVYTVHNLEPHSDGTSDRLLHELATWSLVRLVDRVHVHSEAAGDIVKSKYGRKDGIVVIPLGNFIDYYPRGISKSEARQRLNIASGLSLFLFLGLVRQYKGLEELIPAFLGLDAGSDDKLLLIVGAAPDKKYEAGIAEIVGSQPNIKFRSGYVPDEMLQVFLAASDVVVFPYRAATTSAGAVMALSYGRPIIGPVSPAFSHLVTEQTGVLYDPSVPGALTAALRTGADRTWDEESILEFAHRFDWHKLGPSLRALYDRASEGRGLSS